MITGAEQPFTDLTKNEQLLIICKNPNVTFEYVQRLLGEGANPRYEDQTPPKKGFTIMHRACQYGAIEAVRCFLQNDRSLVAIKTSANWTPAHSASMYGRSDVVEFLVKNGARNTETADKCGHHTPSTLAERTLDCVQNNVTKIPEGASKNSSDYSKIVFIWKKRAEHASSGNRKKRNPELIIDDIEIPNPKVIPIPPPGRSSNDVAEEHVSQPTTLGIDSHSDNLAPLVQQIVIDTQAAPPPSIPLPLIPTPIPEEDNDHQSSNASSVAAEKSDDDLRKIKIENLSLVEWFKNEKGKAKDKAKKLRKKHKLNNIELLRCLLLNDPGASSRPIEVSGANLRFIPFFYNTITAWLPIHLAAIYNESDLITVLVRYAKIDVNMQQEGTKNTPLHLASIGGCVRTIALLINTLNADPNIQNHHGCIALQEAAAKDNSGKAICALLDNSPSITVDDSGRYGFTALHSAARYGKVDNIKILLGRGADPFKISLDGRTPRNIDPEANEIATMQILEAAEVEENTSHKAKNRRYQTWLERKDYSSLCGTFITAAQIGDIPELQGIFTVYPDVLTMDFHGTTALHSAFRIEDGNLLLREITILIEWLKIKNLLPAALNCLDISKQSPLHYAARWNCSEVADLFLENGADPLLSNQEGFSSFHEAAAKGCDNTVRIFIKHEVNVNALSQTGSRPVLHSATRFGHTTTTQLLLDNGAALDAVGLYNETALDSALKECAKNISGECYHFEIVQFLLSRKCPYHSNLLRFLPETIRTLLLSTQQIPQEAPLVDVPAANPPAEHPVTAISPLTHRLLQVDLRSEDLDPYAQKIDGSNPGALYRKKDDGSCWLGKMGVDPLHQDDKLAIQRNMSSRTRAIVGVRLDAVKEKIGMDFYSILADGRYEVPETRLAVLPTLNVYITNKSDYAATIACSFGNVNDSRARTTVFAMSHWYDNFISLKSHPNFMAEIKEGRIPENISINYSGQLYNFPTTPIIRLLAHARVLGDIDVLGVTLGNIGFIPTAKGLSLVKIDGSHIFKAYERDDYIHSACYASAGSRKIRDIQCNSFSAGMVSVIQWNSFTALQKGIYIEELAKGFALCQDKQFLQFMLLRDNKYQKYGCEDNISNIPYINWIGDWLKRQPMEDYGEEINKYLASNKPAVDAWVNEKKIALGLCPQPHANVSIVPATATAISSDLTHTLTVFTELPNHITGPSTLSAQVIFNTYKIWWQAKAYWPNSKALFSMALQHTGGDHIFASTAIGHITAERSQQIIELLSKKIPANTLQQTLSGWTISQIVMQFNSMLYYSNGENKPEDVIILNLIPRLDNMLRHERASFLSWAEEYRKQNSLPRVTPIVEITNSTQALSVNLTTTGGTLFAPPTRRLPPPRPEDRVIINEITELLHKASEENACFNDERLRKYCEDMNLRLASYRGHPLTSAEKSQLLVLKEELDNKVHITITTRLLNERYPEKDDEDADYKSYRENTGITLNGYRTHILSKEEVTDLHAIEKELEDLAPVVSLLARN